MIIKNKIYSRIYSSKHLKYLLFIFFLQKCRARKLHQGKREVCSTWQLPWSALASGHLCRSLSSPMWVSSRVQLLLFLGKRGAQGQRLSFVWKCGYVRGGQKYRSDYRTLLLLRYSWIKFKSHFTMYLLMDRRTWWRATTMRASNTMLWWRYRPQRFEIWRVRQHNCVGENVSGRN